jgi:hypothetical protein
MAKTLAKSKIRPGDKGFMGRVEIQGRKMWDVRS